MAVLSNDAQAIRDMDSTVELSFGNTIDSVTTVGASCGSLVKLLSNFARSMYSAIVVDKNKEAATAKEKALHDKLGAYGEDMFDFSAVWADVRSTLGSFTDLAESSVTAFDSISGLAAGFASPGVAVEAFNTSALDPNTIDFTADKTDKSASVFQHGSGSPTACARSLLAGSMQAVGKVTAGTWNNLMQVGRAASLTIAGGMKLYDNFTAGLQNVSIQNLLALVTDKKEILQRIKSAAQKIADDCAKINAEDYQLNLADHIRQVQSQLLSISDTLENMELSMLSGAVLDRKKWKTSKSGIKAAADDLAGIKDILGIGAAHRFFLIAGQLELLKAYSNQLERKLELVNDLSDNIASFQSELRNIKMDNVLAPLVDMVLCRLKLMIDDMDGVIIRNNIVTYGTKILGWIVELKAIAEIMRQLDKIPQEPLDNITNGFKPIFDKFDSFMNNARESMSSSVDFIVLTNLIKTYDRLVTNKISREMVNDGITAYANSISIECDRLIVECDNNSGIIDLYLKDLGDGAKEAIAAVGVMSEFLGEKGLTEALDDPLSLIRGKILDLFVESKAIKAAGQVASCCGKNGGDKTVIKALRQLIGVAEQDLRSKSLIDQALNGSDDDYVREVFKQDIPKYKDTLAAINRMSSSPCITPN